MKNSLKVIFFISLFSPFIWSCEKLFETGSITSIEVDSDTITDPNKSIFLVNGILSEFQKLASQYIVLGELRGDLLDITANSNEYLRQISEHREQSDNPYISIAPFYSLINNCNYALKKIDSNNSNVKPDYVVIEGIRAWVYLQLGIHFGKVVYLDSQVTDISDIKSLNSKPALEFGQLIDTLLVRLEPYASVTLPTLPIKYSCPPVNFILGELYLWDGDYQNAASMYKLIIQNDGTSATSQNRYKLSTFTVNYWSDIYSYTRADGGLDNEMLWIMVFDQDQGNSNNLNALFSKSYGNYMLKPSDGAVANWDGQRMDDLKTWGDTYRGINNSYSIVGGEPVVQKYLYNKNNFSQNTELYLARAALVYLRYAEAVNCLGKPTLAIAAINKGLSKANLAASVKSNEIPSPALAYYNFSDTRYDLSKGVRGRVSLENITMLPLPSLNDSILFVEDAILQEYALETAFEGNRWGDCLRIALRRDIPSYLSEKISSKTNDPARAQSIKTQLNNKVNWYLPFIFQ